MLLARGSRALHIFQQAFEATMTHLCDLGGKIAPHKSRLFSTCASHRSWLADYCWVPIGQQIKLVHNLRDLGSSLNFGAAPSTSLSQSRLAKAIATLHRVHRLPHTRAQKGKFAIACCHSQ
eukprot:2913839-Karenia_brevis.AAC.1